MRLILFTFIFFSIVLSSYGQSAINKKISFGADDLSIEEALTKLSEETEINIAFSNSILPDDKSISLVANQQSVKQVLRSILADTNISFKLVSNQVILFREDTSKLKTININGYIEDAETGERLVGANIYNPNNAYGTDSNEYGYFNFYGVPNVDSIFVSYLGYETQKFLVRKEAGQNLTIKLVPIFFEEIVVTADDGTEDFLRRPQSGVDRLDLSALQHVTSIGGESDIFQAAYRLSGVNSGADGVGGLHVRGGNLDQNLILLDGAPIYRPEHAIGIISVFNSDAIRSAKVYKGNFPAKYGGRLSSVLDVQTKEGNNQDYEGNITLGLLTAKASFQGPIIKDNASFFISYRRSLTDLYLPEITRIVAEKDSVDGFSDYFFHDLNMKTNFRIGKSDRFYLSYYEGKDDFFNQRQQPEFRDSFPDINGNSLPGTFREDNTESLNWGNQMASFRWNHLFGDRIFANTTAYLSKFDFSSSTEFRSIGEYDNGLEDLIYVERNFRSEVRDIGLRTDLEFLQSERLNFKFGGGIIQHELSPGSFQNRIDFEEIPSLDEDLSILSSLEVIPLETTEAFAYYETGISLSRQLHITLGLHGRYWQNEDGTYKHTSVLPRFGLDYQISDAISFSASYLEMIQYMHLLTKSDIGLPGDIWVPSTENVIPETATHFQVGMQLNLKKDLIVKVNGYYKELNNLVEFLEGDSTNILNALNFESKVTQGQGTSKGIELDVIKSGDRLNAQMNYTLSKTDRQFDEINNGNPYPYRFDLRHMFSIGGSYNFNKKWSMNVNWIYNSGINLTIPIGKYRVPSPFNGVDPLETIVFSEKNGQKLLANQRLDIGMNYKFEGQKLKHNLSFGIYNAYNSLNPLYYKLRRNPEDRSKLQFVSVSLLPISPSFSYSLSF